MKLLALALFVSFAASAEGDCADYPIGWYDADGEEFNCEWYSWKSNCLFYGDGYANFNHTANEACCTCGGGMDPILLPSSSPSVIPTAVPSSLPSSRPTVAPSSAPSAIPSNAPSASPTISLMPSSSPSSAPTQLVILEYRTEGDFSDLDDEEVCDGLLQGCSDSCESNDIVAGCTNCTIIERQNSTSARMLRRKLTTSQVIIAELTATQTTDSFDISSLNQTVMNQGFQDVTNQTIDSFTCYSENCPSQSPSSPPSLSTIPSSTPSKSSSPSSPPSLSTSPSSAPSKSSSPSSAPSKSNSPSNSPSYAPPFTGVRGDPHFATWAGERFDFHGLCDLVLLQNHKFKGIGMDIHIRTRATFLWSYVSSMVIRIGEDSLEVSGDKDETRYWINKERGGAIKEDELTLPIKLAGFPIKFTRLSNLAQQFIIELGSEEQITIETWKGMVSINMIGVKKQDFEHSLGLMGSFDNGLLIGRDNQTVFKDLNKFGSEWQVHEYEPILFHNVQRPQAPTKCEIPTTTEMRRRLGEVQISKSDAEIACKDVNNEDFDLCVFDVMATSNLDVVGAY